MLGSALLAVTVASAHVDLGVANVSIAALKAVLIGVWFMHLRRATPPVRLTVLAAVWLVSLLGLTLADHLTR